MSITISQLPLSVSVSPSDLVIVDQTISGQLQTNAATVSQITANVQSQLTSINSSVGSSLIGYQPSIGTPTTIQTELRSVDTSVNSINASVNSINASVNSITATQSSFIASTNSALSIVQNEINALTLSQASGVIGYATLSLMNADLAHPAGTVALVTNDSNATNNTWYLKSGASGSGAWTAESNAPLALETAARISADALKVDGVNGKNLFNPAAPDYAPGYFVVSTNGILQANSAINATGFIPVIAGLPYAFSVEYYLCWYNSAKVYISGLANGAPGVIVAPVGAAFVRASFINTVTTFQIEQNTEITPYEKFSLYLNMSEVKSGSITNPLYAPSSVSPDKTNFLQVSKNLFNSIADGVLTNTFMGNDGGLYSGSGYLVSDYIPVTSGITYVGSYTGSTSIPVRFTTYFDANFAVVAGGSNAAIANFTIPAMVVYVRVTAYNVLSVFTGIQLEIGTTPTAFQAFGYSLVLSSGIPFYLPPTTVATLWTGKSWAALGDSITYENYWQPNVAASLGLTYTNLGVSGTTLSGASGSTTAMCQATRIATIPSGTNLITVLAGTNDWSRSVPLGTLGSTDPTTFYGAIYTLITNLYTASPTIRIVMLTTTYGEMYGNVAPNSANWPNAYTNSIGLTTMSYADAIRLACRYYGVVCIDTQGMCGWNTTNIRTFVQDDGGLLHPNTLGGNRMSEVVRGGLRSIEPFI